MRWRRRQPGRCGYKGGFSRAKEERRHRNKVTGSYWVPVCTHLHLDYQTVARCKRGKKGESEKKKSLTTPEGNQRNINDLAPDQLCVPLIHNSLTSLGTVPVLVRCPGRHAFCIGHSTRRLGHLILQGCGTGPWREKTGQSQTEIWPWIWDVFA